MLGTAILEVAIGLVFVYLLVGLVCQAICSKVSEWLNWRGRDLEAGIRDYILQGNVDALPAFYRHPLILSLTPKASPLARLLNTARPTGALRGDQTPAYIPARTFVLALLDTFVPNAGRASTVDQLVGVIAALPPISPVRASLLGLVTQADRTIEQSRGNIENWFDAVMEQVSREYQTNMWKLAFLIAMMVSVVLNVDSLAIADRLWRDSAERALVVAAAQQLNQPAPGSQMAVAELERLELPIGWDLSSSSEAWVFPRDWLSSSNDVVDAGTLFRKVLGWFLTAFAGAQEAPFWFDLLKKMTKRE